MNTLISPKCIAQPNRWMNIVTIYLYVMFCLIFFIGSALEIYLKGQNSSVCSGHNLIAVCKIDGANAFVWSAPPLLLYKISRM